jgi:hypothetical protein
VVEVLESEVPLVFFEPAIDCKYNKRRRRRIRIIRRRRTRRRIFIYLFL